MYAIHCMHLNHYVIIVPNTIGLPVLAIVEQYVPVLGCHNKMQLIPIYLDPYLVGYLTMANVSTYARGIPMFYI